MVDGVFVVATDAERAGRLAKERPSAVGGARGALVASTDAERLVSRLIRTLDAGAAGNIAGRLLSGPLENATGSVSASREGLEGRLSVELDER